MVNEAVAFVVANAGGTAQEALNSATDIVILGETDPRDEKWAGSRKSEALAAELAADAAGRRKKPLRVVPFSALAALPEIRALAITCEFSKPESYVPPGAARSRRKLSVTMLDDVRGPDGKHVGYSLRRGLVNDPAFRC